MLSPPSTTMLRRLFNRTRPEDLRAHYRRALGKGVALGVKVVSSHGLPISGELANLSAGGASIEFGEGVEGELTLGTEKDLVFSSLTSKPVRVRAVVRTTPEDGEHTRYGFEFLDASEFHAALELGFFKFFNRRRQRRAHPALGENLSADVSFAGMQKAVKIHDISHRGAAFHVDQEFSDLLSIGTEIELAFQVPKTDCSLVYCAVVRNMTVETKSVRVGVEMSVLSGSDSRRNIKRSVAALGDYIDRRISEMDRYNSAYH